MVPYEGEADTAAFSLNREGHYTPLDGWKAHKYPYPYPQVVSSIGGGLQSVTDLQTIDLILEDADLYPKRRLHIAGILFGLH